MTSPINQAIQCYEQAIAFLIKDPPEVPTSTQVLEILTARDFLQYLLANTPDKSGVQLERISDLDRQLRKHANVIIRVRDTSSQSVNWLESFKPDEKAWWWFLESPNRKLNDCLWNGVSISCITAAFSLIGDIIPRFAIGSPDLLSSFFVTLQGVLGLASAGSILKALEGTAKQVSSQPIAHLRLPQWQKISSIFSAVFLLFTLGLRFSLPTFSNIYNQWGKENYNKGDWSSAEANYQRALKLNPDNEVAHFWLGSLYEDLQNNEAARSQYQLAMQGQYIPAVNNLARLHILNNKNSAAVLLLYKALGSESEKQKKLNPKVKHAIWKNLGWARFQMKDYPGAEMYLQDAIDLQKSAKLTEDTAAPHCLLAQVKEAKMDKISARVAWNACVQDANAFNLDEDGWVIKAQQRLADAEKSKKKK